MNFIKFRFKGNFTLNNWPLIVQYLENYRVVYNFKVEKWVPPPINWLKCDINGASKGNPRPSSASFCIRDHEGNLIVAKGVRIQVTSNLIAEVITIRECWCFLDIICCLFGNNSYFGGTAGNSMECGFGSQLHSEFEGNCVIKGTTSLREGNTLADYFA